MAPVNLHDADIDIAGFFRRFVKEVTSSPIYVALCPLLAEHPTTISFYQGVRPAQRRPNLLLAAMHASILRDPSHDLAGWYATAGGHRSPSDPALAGALDAFLADRRLELTRLVADGATQTNEVGRSALLLPALGFVHAGVGRRLGLVEIGTSAALNLRLDAYRITYETASEPQQVSTPVDFGPPHSSVHIRCDASRSPEPIPESAIRSMSIGSRRGSDLNPLDVHDEAQARWLRALIWPDETERFDRLRNALAAARSFPVDVVAGDAVALVAGQIESVPAEEHPVVITTWVLTYLPPEHRRAFVGELQNAAGRRPVSWVCLEHPSYCEGLPWPDDVLDAWGTTGGGSRGDTSMSGNPVVVHDFDAGRHTARWNATAHPHGRWINWHPTTASTSAAEYRGA